MDVQDLFHHALRSLPEAVGDLLRDDRDPTEFVFATFDGASTIGAALLASDIALEKKIDPVRARAEVDQLVTAARGRGEELMVSMMVTCGMLTKLLRLANMDAMSRLSVISWLDAPLASGHLRVLAVAGDELRATSVDGFGIGDEDEVPVSSSLLN